MIIPAQIPELTREEQNRFWQQVDFKLDLNACWPWMGAVWEGYGIFYVKNADYRSHRVAWSIINGPIPDGLFVCHTCDNRPCCNWNHLVAETSRWNIDDKVAKGRAQRLKGEMNAWHRLTDSKVIQARLLHSRGVKMKVIAEMFGVDRSAVDLAVKRKTWSHVP